MLLGRRGAKRTLPLGLSSWQEHREESEVLPVAKTSLLREEQKEHLKGEMGQAKRALEPE